MNQVYESNFQGIWNRDLDVTILILQEVKANCTIDEDNNPSKDIIERYKTLI